MFRTSLRARPTRAPFAGVRAGLAAAALCAAGALSTATPLAAQGGTGKPTVAVLYFNNGALIGGADYAPLSKGMADMLITELARNPDITVIERDRLQELLEEQDLAVSGRVDQATAVRIGKLLGAQHMITGGFVIDPKEKIRIDVRSFKVETSEVEYVESVLGKSEDLLELVTQLGAKVNDGLKLPPRPRDVGSDAGAKSGNQFRAMLLMSRALEAQDANDNATAIALLKQASEASPEFERPKVLLATLERGTPEEEQDGDTTRR
jgi:TolB-like protein